MWVLSLQVGLKIRGILSSDFCAARRRPFLMETNLADTLLLFSIVNEVIPYQTLALGARTR